MYLYKNNSQFVGRQIYNINNTNFLYYDSLLPVILEVKEEYIGATNANLQVYTREECTVAYLVYEYGEHFRLAPKTPLDILNHPNSTKI